MKRRIANKILTCWSQENAGRVRPSRVTVRWRWATWAEAHAVVQRRARRRAFLIA